MKREEKEKEYDDEEIEWNNVEDEDGEEESI